MHEGRTYRRGIARAVRRGGRGDAHALRRPEGGAVFAPDERTLPRQITTIAVHTLPSADREALSGGIAVYSREELYARLEDFGS